MAYCSQTDIEDAITAALLIELTDDAGAGSVDTTVLGREIADADAVINGHLRAHYDVPLGSTPNLIRRLSIKLTTYGLYSRRAAAFAGMPEHVREGYDWAMQQLSFVRSGMLDLGIEPPPAASTAEIAQTDGPDRLFTSDTLKDFV